MFLGFVVFAAIVAAVLWLVATYNHLVATKQRVARAWSNLDVPVRERHDELPRLLEICAKYLHNDRAALDRVLEARTAIFAARHSFDPAVLGPAEIDLRRELGTLLSLAGNDGDLVANQHFMILRRRLAEIGEQIAERRKLYNDAVNENNIAIEQFPGRWIAGIGAFRTFEPLDF
jgi:LemA protein